MKHEKGICALCSEEMPGVMNIPRKVQYKNGVSYKHGIYSQTLVRQCFPALDKLIPSFFHEPSHNQHQKLCPHSYLPCPPPMDLSCWGFSLPSKSSRFCPYIRHHCEARESWFNIYLCMTHLLESSLTKELGSCFLCHSSFHRAWMPDFNLREM